MRCDVCIVGAGAAGLMASIFAARRGADVVVVERNTTAGRKLLRTGRGRCNITHQASVEEFVRACEPYGRFLKHSLYTFGPEQVREFFAEHGLDTRVEPSGCVFPVTDRATDVKNVLLAQAKDAGVRLVYGRLAYPVQKSESGFIVKCDGDSVECRAVIIATGGVSWPKTGSTGHGYGIAAALGHGVIEPGAALVPLVTKEKWCRKLSGIGIQEVQISVKVGDMKRSSQIGPMMFTHDGIGGPAVFDFSREMADWWSANVPVELSVDLLPGMDRHKTEQKLIALCNANPKKRVSALLCELFPKALSEQLCRMAGCGDTKASQLSKGNRQTLVTMVKGLTLHVVGTRPIEEATVTRGGVDTRQIDPTTMQSKLCPGLFFAGEVMDADGPCGGYNLQIAWSTGALAGTSAAGVVRE